MTAIDPATAPAAKALRKPRRRGVNLPLVAGAIIVGLILFCALAADWIAPMDPYTQNLAGRMLPPSWVEGGVAEHFLGTDALGRDYLSRLIYGARVSLGIGLSIVAISGTIGVSLGILAGYFGGRVDTLVTYLVTVRLALPAVIVALTVVAIVGNSFATILTVLGLLLWDQFAIVSRAVTQQIASQDFILAARATGRPLWKILGLEILPNILPMVVVVATVEMASAIMVEASLSFLGLGVQPPTPSWGLMMSEGKENIFFTSWLILFPGIALFCLVLGINLLGEGLRDRMAPPGAD